MTKKNKYSIISQKGQKMITVIPRLTLSTGKPIRHLMMRSVSVMKVRFKMGMIILPIWALLIILQVGQPLQRTTD